jgi:peptidoglycan/xylan/chitin deacetylase (PgdA/CDA1 family)
VNRAFKHVAEGFLVASGAARFARRRLRGRTLVLAYHNVLPEGSPRAGDLSLHLPQRDFARQLDVLARTHQVVPISALGEAAQTSRRPRVVITFDDAYTGALSCGVEELVKRRMPATFFVAPDLLGSVTWWDILAEREGGAIGEGQRREALYALGGSRDAILGPAYEHSMKPGTQRRLARIGTESELSEAARRPGITIGSHTMSHPNLAALDAPALDAELSDSRRWLDDRFTNTVPWLTYPYGLFSVSVQRAAERAGYRGAFRIDGGWAPKSMNSPYVVPRLNIPAGLSLNGFRLRLAGL